PPTTKIDAQDQGVREPGRRPDGPRWTRTVQRGTGAENRCTLLREPKPLFRIAKLWPRWLAALTRRGENRSRAVVDAMARPDGAYSLLELSETGTCAGVVDAHRAGRLPLRRGAARALTPPRLPRGERMTTDRPCLPQRTTAARLIVAIRGEQAAQYAPVLETLAGAGIRSIELTLSTPGTLEQLPGLLERFSDQLDIG